MSARTCGVKLTVTWHCQNVCWNDAIHWSIIWCWRATPLFPHDSSCSDCCTQYFPGVCKSFEISQGITPNYSSTRTFCLQVFGKLYLTSMSAQTYIINVVTDRSLVTWCNNNCSEVKKASRCYRWKVCQIHTVLLFVVGRCPEQNVFVSSSNFTWLVEQWLS